MPLRVGLSPDSPPAWRQTGHKRAGQKNRHDRVFPLRLVSDSRKQISVCPIGKRSAARLQPPSPRGLPHTMKTIEAIQFSLETMSEKAIGGSIGKLTRRANYARTGRRAGGRACVCGKSWDIP